MSKTPSHSRRSRRHCRGGAALAGVILAAALLPGCSAMILADRPPASASPASTSPASSEASTAPQASASAQASASPTPDTAAALADAAALCGLIDDVTLMGLIGEAPVGKGILVPGSLLPACVFGDIVVSGVQITKSPAEEWVSSLPSIVSTMTSMPAGVIDSGILKKLNDVSLLIAAGTQFSAEESCDYFSLLAEAQGLEADSTQIVNYYPDQVAPVAVVAQQCVSGTFTSLLVSRSDLAVDQATYLQVLDALEGLG